MRAKMCRLLLFIRSFIFYPKICFVVLIFSNNSCHAVCGIASFWRRKTPLTHEGKYPFPFVSSNSRLKCSLTHCLPGIMQSLRQSGFTLFNSQPFHVEFVRPNIWHDILYWNIHLWNRWKLHWLINLCSLAVVKRPVKYFRLRLVYLVIL